MAPLFVRLLLLIAATAPLGCVSVVIIQRSVPSIGEQLSGTRVTLPRPAGPPTVVRD